MFTPWSGLEVQILSLASGRWVVSKPGGQLRAAHRPQAMARACGIGEDALSIPEDILFKGHG